MFNRKLLLSVFAVSSLALTACGNDETEDESQDTTAPVEDQVDQEDNEVDTYTNLTMQAVDAFDTFMDEYPDAKVSKIQLDKDMGDFLYKIEGFMENKEYELEIDPMTGDILKKEEDSDDDQDEIAISREQVKKVNDLLDNSLTDAGENAELEEWTLDEDDGVIQLELEIKQGELDDIEYTYNIDSGDLIEKDD